MSLNERTEFRATAWKLAEQEFSASFSEDRSGALLDELLREYKATGSSVTPDEWLRTRLESIFHCAQQRPIWVHSFPTWPFHKGRPMVFIAQCSTPVSEVAKFKLAIDDTLYLFGIRDEVAPGIFEMIYRVVSQSAGTRDLAIVLE